MGAEEQDEDEKPSVVVQPKIESKQSPKVQRPVPPTKCSPPKEEIKPQLRPSTSKVVKVLRNEFAIRRLVLTFDDIRPDRLSAESCRELGALYALLVSF